MKNKLHWSVWVFLAVLIVFTLVQRRMPSARASGQGLVGWAWSSNIGWISFNSANPTSGGGNYSVNLDTATGALSGYAWSSNVGWITFNANDVAGCPNGSCPPMANLETGAVTGWAKLVSDGSWIQLSGIHHESPNQSGTGGVTLDPSPGAFKGFAWEPVEIGWINFDTGGNRVTCPSCAHVIEPLAVSCSHSPASVISGQTVTYQVGVTGGSGIYKYSLITSDGTNPPDSATTTATSYSQFLNVFSKPDTYAPVAVVKDSSGGTANAQCGSVKAKAPLTLTIGATASEATQATYSLRKGHSFGMRLENSLPAYNKVSNPDGYVCTKVLPSKPQANWTGKWSGDAGTGETDVDGLDTTQPGHFTFSIKCRSQATQTIQDASAQLDVHAVYQSEI